MGIDYSAQWGKNGVGAWQLLESGWGIFNISAFVLLDFSWGHIDMNINYIKRNVAQITEWVHYWWLESSRFAEMDISYTNVNKVLPNKDEKIYWQGGPVKWRCWFYFPQIFFLLLGIIVFELVEVYFFRWVVVVFLSLVFLRSIFLTFEKYIITEKRIIIRGLLRITTFDFENYLKFHQFHALEYKCVPRINGNDITIATFKCFDGVSIISVGFNFLSKKNFYEVIHVLQRITIDNITGETRDEY